MRWVFRPMGLVLVLTVASCRTGGRAAGETPRAAPPGIQLEDLANR